jgi:DNA-binding XRE family transcriptional regulator
MAALAIFAKRAPRQVGLFSSTGMSDTCAFAMNRSSAKRRLVRARRVHCSRSRKAWVTASVLVSPVQVAQGRRRAEMSQADFARKLGVSRKTISDLERGAGEHISLKTVMAAMALAGFALYSAQRRPPTQEEIMTRRAADRARAEGLLDAGGLAERPSAGTSRSWSSPPSAKSPSSPAKSPPLATSPPRSPSSSPAAPQGRKRSA